MLTQEQLKYEINYDPLTGIFMWRRSGSGRNYGERAGQVNSRGYRKITLNRKMWTASHLAWLSVYGTLPTMLDHKNRNSSDDRIDNLRLATRSQNGANRGNVKNTATKTRGVCISADRKKFIAQIRINGNRRYLGTFSTITEAKEVYNKAAEKAFGEFYVST